MDRMEAVLHRAQMDEEYRQALEKTRQLEPKYLEILDTLPREQREILEAYITACEAMDDELLRIACQDGGKL